MRFGSFGQRRRRPGIPDSSLVDRVGIVPVQAGFSGVSAISRNGLADDGFAILPLVGLCRINSKGRERENGASDVHSGREPASRGGGGGGGVRVGGAVTERRLCGSSGCLGLGRISARTWPNPGF